MTSMRKQLWDEAAYWVRSRLIFQLQKEVWDSVAWTTRPVWDEVWERVRTMAEEQVYDTLGRGKEE